MIRKILVGRWALAKMLNAELIRRQFMFSFNETRFM
jgi:hypothetical protein